jgi:hypothetical protein
LIFSAMVAAAGVVSARHIAQTHVRGWSTASTRAIGGSRRRPRATVAEQQAALISSRLPTATHMSGEVKGMQCSSTLGELRSTPVRPQTDALSCSSDRACRQDDGSVWKETAATLQQPFSDRAVAVCEMSLVGVLTSVVTLLFLLQFKVQACCRKSLCVRTDVAWGL